LDALTAPAFVTADQDAAVRFRAGSSLNSVYNSTMPTFSSLALRRGVRRLLSAASFPIHRGEKIGIVGANGCGKSSLLGLIMGQLQPDAGSFDMPAQLVVAHVAQELEACSRDAIEFVMDGDEELRATQQAIASAESSDAGGVLGELHARFA